MSADVIPTTWGMLEVGALVMDANGKHWRVREKRSKLPQLAFLISDADGRGVWVVKTHDDDVVLIDENGGRAVDVVLGILGGQMRMERLPAGPDRPAVRAMYRAHLFHIHGVSVSPTADKESGTLAELRELHALEHARAVPVGIPHIHDLEV